MSTELLRTEKLYIEFTEDDIVRVVIEPNAHIEHEDLDRNHEIFKENLKQRRVPFIIIFGKFSTSDKQSREKFAHEERANYKLMEALVLNTLAHKLVANFHVNFYSPKYPTRIFATEKAAIKWIQENRKHYEEITKNE